MTGIREPEREELLRLNQKQGLFYEGPQGRNLPTRVWSKMRGRMHKTRNSIGIGADVYQLHSTWLGDLSDKRVLDLGCYAGNALSLPIAKSAKSYLGIDLSGPAIERLDAKLKAAGHKNAVARKVDFLDPAFT